MEALKDKEKVELNNKLKKDKIDKLLRRVGIYSMSVEDVEKLVEQNNMNIKKIEQLKGENEEVKKELLRVIKYITDGLNDNILNRYSGYHGITVEEGKVLIPFEASEKVIQNMIKLEIKYR